MGPIHRENVAQNPVAARPLITVHYQIEVCCCRDTAAPKFLAHRRLPFFGCQLDTDNKYALDPPIQRTDVPTPNPRRVPEGASTRTGASSRSHSTCGTSNCPRFGATSHAADKPYKVTEKRHQLFGRDTLFPANRWRFAGGAGDAIRYSNDRSTHDKGQRAGAVHHDTVRNAVCYLVNDRGRLLARHRSAQW